MRNMSFALTTAQMRARTKRVTRRMGWWQATPGDVVQPVEKAQGIPKGEHVVKIDGPIRFVHAAPEPLRRLLDDADYGRRELELEGPLDMTPAQFVAWFCRTHRVLESVPGHRPIRTRPCTPDDAPMRIAFDFVEASAGA